MATTVQQAADRADREPDQGDSGPGNNAQAPATSIASTGRATRAPRRTGNGVPSRRGAARATRPGIARAAPQPQHRGTLHRLILVQTAVVLIIVLAALPFVSAA